jgi:basic membrane lipoprotein Med (substrate-binding protein (PBP1-ABC) superfamily)
MFLSNQLRICVAGLLLAGLLLSAACTTRDLTVEAGAHKAKVGIVYDIGGKDDRSFNAAAYQGMLRAKQELPIVLRDVEPGDPTSIEPVRAIRLQPGDRRRFCARANFGSRGQRLSAVAFRHH